MTSRSATRRRVEKTLALCLLLSLVIFLLSACGGNPQTQQQTNKDKQALDNSLAQARSIGVPANLLQPIIQQEQQLTGTHAPLSLLGDQPVNNYYQDLSARYSQLNSQVIGLETQITQQLDYQASQALQTMSNALSERQDQNFVEAQTFAAQLTSYQQALAKAQYPKDYLRISSAAQVPPRLCT